MRPAIGNTRVLLGMFLAVALVALPAVAQNGGPHPPGTYNGHFLAPAPSVTSIGGIGASHLPPPLPSVTSLPNYNFQYHYGYGRYFQSRNRYTHYNGRGSYGGSYAIPYYYPADNSAYGYDYVGAGPDLYSGPPPGPNDPVLHMIVEQPPASPYGPPWEEQPYAQPPAAAQPASTPQPEVKPGEPTVLVFRNGKQQEVVNYAIMGDTLYVFDKGKMKIAMADLDIPATVQANDDRGMEFRMPPPSKKKVTSTPAPQSSTPDTTKSSQPPNIAAVMPQ
ncbi:MAG TPA: hypothetical protein VFB04_14510 [Terriglobales bacterium]|nr:hypothetical protein [Terriglobales bacterium]